VRRNASWDDWRAVALALRVARDHALSVAQTNRPFGRKYTKALAAWVARNELADINKSVRGTAIKIADNLADIYHTVG
jgi:hypothetical protein